MTEPSLSGLKTILLEARTLTGAARDVYLARVCGDRADLREEIESLLAFESAVPSLMDDGGLLQRLRDKADVGPDGNGPDGVAGSETVDLDADTGLAVGRGASEAVGETIGPYRLIEVIGEGGMGVVYRAEQVTPIRREVALKLIRRGLDTDRVVARFDSERQALARMDHPAIARVLDAGASADGRPYFVMELVQGAPITEACDAERLTLRERIELAMAVCHGVQHAHQKGIIHRDLKPSNILVARPEGAPIAPKIIDFGIAKAIEEPLTDYTLLTRVGQLIGTPDYMSPEQAGVLDVDVDTRTDVYALGVLLYELLSGRRPHVFERRTQEEVQHVLRHEEPERPSTSLRTGGRRRLTRSTTILDEATRARIADSRRTTADRLRRQLSGDLDNIVLKAMQKEPGRRYGSVEQLGDDLRRYLDGKPVLARPDTWTYRSGKFVRRHAVAVGVATAAILMLVTFAVLTAIQSARVARERDRALAAERRARTEAETSKQVSDFLVDLFQVSDPQRARGNTITAREILDRGAQRVGAELAARPQVQGKLLHTIANTYKNLGLYDDAAVLMAQAVEARERGAPAEVEESLNELGDIERYRGRLTEAEPILRRALEVREAQYGHEHPKVAQTLNNLAILLDDQGKHDEAETMHREALRIRKATLGPKDAAVSNSLSNLAIVLRHRGTYEASEQTAREALAMRREQYGADHPLVAQTSNLLGVTLAETGKYAAAEAAFREALSIRRKVLGARHPQLADTLTSLAAALQDQNKLDQAEPLYLEALTIHRALAGGAAVAGSPAGRASRDGVAGAAGASASGDGLRAAAAKAGDAGGGAGGVSASADGLRGGAATPRGAGGGGAGAGSMSLAQVLNNLATLYEQRGDLRQAEAYYQESLAMRRALRGDRHPAVAVVLNNLAKLRLSLGQPAAAERLAREALAMRIDLLGANNPNTAVTRVVLGSILRARGALAAAEEQLRAGLAFEGPQTPADHPTLVQVRIGLARVLLDRQRPAEAEGLLRTALADRTKRFPASDWRVADVQVALARALLAQGRTNDAAVLLASSAPALHGAGPGQQALQREAAQATAVLQARLRQSEAALARATPEP